MENIVNFLYLHTCRKLTKYSGSQILSRSKTESLLELRLQLTKTEKKCISTEQKLDPKLI